MNAAERKARAERARQILFGAPPSPPAGADVVCKAVKAAPAPSGKPAKRSTAPVPVVTGKPLAASAPTLAAASAPAPVVGYKATSLPHVQEAVNMGRAPKKFAPGELQAGESVWYRGDRYWLTRVPKDWMESFYVRISSRAVRPEAPEPQDAESFAVFADCVDRAPVRRNPFAGRQPTIADVQRTERAKRGIKDVGDEVAELLRKAKGIDDMYRTAAKYLGVPEKDLRAKYGHLNNGQQRMNLGNRMRNAAKKRAK